MESTLAGCASVFISATSAAATYWASMYHECSPPCGERKGGSPSEVSGFTRRSTRRSAMPASWARPIPSVSRTRPSTSPWKLPPLSTAPSAGKTSGLSETLPISALGDAGELGEADPQRVEDEAQHLTVEVAAAQHGAVRRKDERIVRDAPEIAQDHVACEAERLARRPVDLWHAAQAVRVLHARAVAVRGDDPALGRQAAQVRRGRELARVRPEPVDPLVERRVGPHQRLERHRPGDVREANQTKRVGDGERRERRHQVRPVEEGQALLRLEGQRGEPGARERLSRRHALPVEPGLALADETQGHVREGHQVPRRAQRSLLGHEGVHAPVQAGEQRLDDRRAYARGAPRERRGEQEHDGANLLLGEGRADAARMAQDEVPLELRALGGRDDDVLELADAGRDAVDRRRARREPLDEAPPRGERARRGRRQVDLLAAARDGLDRFEAQRAAVEIDHPLVSSRTRARSSRSSTVVRRPDATTWRPCTQTSLTARGDMA